MLLIYRFYLDVYKASSILYFSFVASSSCYASFSAPNTWLRNGSKKSSKKKAWAKIGGGGQIPGQISLLKIISIFFFYNLLTRFSINN
jgi:hypothetical protein